MKELLTPEALLTNFKDVRALTRKVIEAFPEKDLFEFNIANLRPFQDGRGVPKSYWTIFLKKDFKRNIHFS